MPRKRTPRLSPNGNGAERSKARHAAASLFTGAGIGDVGFRAAGMTFLAMNELAADRAALARLNFPEAQVFTADVWGVANAFCAAIEERLRSGEELFLLTCTAPCQGMSKNGQGTLLRNVRQGKRPALDPRNRLILPALVITRRLRPRWLVLENVSAMRHTVIDDGNGSLRPILDVVLDALAPEYAGAAYDVEFADYGIPQRRQRLITILTRDCRARQRLESGESLIPAPTHARQGQGARRRWVSVAEALRDFPALDAGSPATASHGQITFHRVPVLDPKKYAWVKHTPPGLSAFDNQCISPACRYQGNPTHGAGRDDDGINRARRDTPLYCQKCGALLPRPYTVEADGGLRIMSGYTSAYKRMDPDLPAPALTRNLSYPCSDQKLHPFEHRVLSLAEALRLQTLDAYPYEWGPLQFEDGKGKMATDTLMRLVIGESVPPRFMELLGRRLVALSSKGIDSSP